ncbi:MAG: alpha/beta hydrolase family protein [Bacteroidota bacterium]|nr:alpha/beta hydrolase family protein [Bacteroidota bacterium]
MKRLNLLLAALFICTVVFSRVQVVDTVSVFSSKMKKEVKNVIILPENYSARRHYPVVYLLHGYSDNYAKWVKTIPVIKAIATARQLILVCPDGGYSSWYFDSPIDSTCQYESYITKDLLHYVDTHYSTIPERSQRAITGLSMGGHGALYLAIRHKDLFGNAGSMSGGVDLRSSPKLFDISKRIGSIELHPDEWDNRSVVNMVNGLKNNELNLIIDCGVSDFFYQINAGLHRRLMALNIDHDYIERPGEHNWQYWANSIQYQLMFFDRCFDKAMTK